MNMYHLLTQQLLVRVNPLAASEEEREKAWLCPSHDCHLVHCSIQSIKQWCLCLKIAVNKELLWCVYLGAEIFESLKICGWFISCRNGPIEEIPAHLKQFWHFRLLIAGDQFGWVFSICRSYSEFQKALRVQPTTHSASEDALGCCGWPSIADSRAGEKEKRLLFL